ncbi:MAG: branched-chain amino acid ABC transporter permease [Candidatus Methanomethylicaceae archaeon]
MIAEFTIYILNGLFFASYMFLLSVGLNIIFGVLKIINLAHGNLYELGCYMAVSILMFIIYGKYPMVLSYPLMIAAGILVGLWGLFIEKAFIKHIYRREVEAQLLLTYAVSLIFLDLVKMIWGLVGYTISEPVWFLGTINIGEYKYPIYYFLVIFISLIIAIIIGVLFSKTKIGKIAIATAFDREAISALGGNDSKIYTQIFIIGAIVSGIGGAIMAPVGLVYPGLGLENQVFAFAILVIGGLGSIKGAFIGSLIVGISRSFGIAIFPEIELALVFLVMIIVLLIRPRGLFGGGA